MTALMQRFLQDEAGATVIRFATNEVSNRPALNSSSARTRRWNGIVVDTPSISVSASERRIRAAASSRVSPQVMILAMSES